MVRVGLCGLRALRGLWGFYVRVRLGGFGACGVFCLSFSSLVLLSSLFLLSSCSCPASLLGFCSWSCLVFLAFGVGWVVGFLSLSDGFRYKKKGRGLRPFLRSCVVVLECFRNYKTIAGGFNS